MSGTREHCACTETAAKKIKLIPFNFSLSLSCVRKNLHGVERRRTAAWNNTPQEHADLVLLCAIARPGGLVASACSSRLLGGIWNLQIFRVLRQLLHPREIQKFIHPAPLSPSLSTNVTPIELSHHLYYGCSSIPLSILYPHPRTMPEQYPLQTIPQGIYTFS